MSIWSRIVRWWKWQPEHPVSGISTDALKDEYRQIHRQVGMDGDQTLSQTMRLRLISDELKRRHIYINAAGVDVYFSNY